MHAITLPCSRGLVEFIELPATQAKHLRHILGHTPDDLNQFLATQALQRFEKHNLIFDFPRIQYAKLDRGESAEVIDASWFTLSNDIYTNPAATTVSGETARVYTSTRAVDPINAKNSIIRFILDVGQFIGSWKTALLIGGATATSTPGSGKIIAAVNDVRDDNNVPLNRDGTTIHLVNWKLKHLDSSEI